MELLWAALPMAGCAVMMVLVMRMLAGGRGEERPSEPDAATGERRAKLEAEVDELRSRVNESKSS